MKYYRYLLIYLWVLMTVIEANAQSVPLRRLLSPSQPMWQIHIDVWNTADPQQIIDLIPADIRPYIVMNVSMSINHNQTTGQFLTSEYGYETCKSWIRTCAENNIWCMLQQSSGGLHHFSETDLSVYEEFFKDYPSFIGFNYAEQFWGFDIAGDPVSSKWADRINFFSKLLPICNKYGGYLTVSWCGNQWSPNINPIAMMKRVPAFAQACRQYKENYILCEKYTQPGYIQDVESICYGAYLSGFSGHYGIRYDDTGWTGPSGTNSEFTPATGLAPHLEHIMLTGMTVIDGPELIWLQCFRETNSVSTTNGFSRRNWERRPQFDNVSIDLYRKILDGTIRIPTRKELIDRTKFVIINDVNSGGNDNMYSSPTDLFQELYRMDNDGNLKDNHSFFKKTGRYPTVPTVYQLDDDLAKSFQFQVNRSAYGTRWPTLTAKVNEFNTQFPSEYTGTIYAGRHENGWVIYNPFKDGTIATGNIPFKYNTCSSMDISFSLYSSGVVKETANQLKIYLNNYDNVLNTGLKTDIIKINGCSSQPTFSFADRGTHQASLVNSSYSGGVLTLTIQHNGGLDLTINCSGTATGRLTAFTTATLVRPSDPPIYTGPYQYEAENWEYKSINSIRGNGTGGSIRNYQGLGYMNYGTNAAASVRRTVNARVAGIHKLEIRYAVTGSNVSNIDLYVNGTKVATPTFTATISLDNWAINTQNVTLNAGTNTIEFRSTGSRASDFYFDNIVLTSASVSDNPPAVTSPVTYCQNANATALTATGTSLKWYTTATGGTAFTTAPTPSTSTAGSTTYYVSQTLNNVESSRASIVVTVNTNPAATVTPGGPTTFCQGSGNVTLNANTGTGLSYVWRNGSNQVGSNLATHSIYITSGSYTVEVTDGNGCKATSAPVTVTVNTPPPAPSVSDISYCQNTIATALIATGASLKWYGTSQTGGTASTTAPTPGTVTVGTTAYYVSQTVNNCEGPRATITVTVNANPAATITPSGPTTFCQGSGNVTLNANTGAGLSYVWRNGSNQVGSNLATHSIYITSGSYTVEVTDANGCKATSAPVTVTVNTPPPVPSVSDISYCQNATATALTATGTSLKWYTVVTGGTPLATAPTPSTTTAGTTNYYVSQTINTCEGLRAIIAVTVNALPSAPTTTSPVTYCQNATATALTATGSSLKWYTVATGGTASTTVPVPSTIFAGTNNYYVSQTVDGCESQRAVIDVQVNELPVATITPNGPTTFSEGGSVTLSANAGSGLSYEWFNGVTQLGAAASYIAISSGSYEVQVTNGFGCKMISAPTIVTVTSTPVNQPSVISIISPIANSVITGAVTISVSISDADGDIVLVEYLDGTTVIGTSTSEPYDFTWNDPSTGSHTITVRVTDSNGGITTSDPLTINTNVISGILSTTYKSFAEVAPNPSSETFKVTSVAKIKNLRLINIYGEVVETISELKGGQPVEIGSDIINGTYLLVVEYVSGEIEVSKLVKLK